MMDTLPPTVASEAAHAEGTTWIRGRGLKVGLTHDPFGFCVIRTADGASILQTASDSWGSGFAPIAFTRDHGFTWNRFFWGYRGYLPLKEPWRHGTRVVQTWSTADRTYFELQPDWNVRRRILFVVGPFYKGAVRIAASVLPSAASRNRIAVTFEAPDGECYAGFGERFNGLDQRGKLLSCWSEEGGIEPGWLRKYLPHLSPESVIPGGEDTTYAPIPFFLSSQGYGMLAEVPEPTHFDMAHTHPDLWRVEAESHQLSLIVFAGSTPASSLRKYTERTGRSLAPRPWVLAPWNQLMGYGGSVLDTARRFREHDIPSSVSHVWTPMLPVAGYEGRETAIREQNETLHDLGFKSLCYLLARVDKHRCAKLWQEAAEKDIFIRNPQGEPYVFPVALNLDNWYTISKIDFTHPGAEAWWHTRLQTMLDLGYDGTMYDFGEYVPPDGRFHDGRDGHYWHNPYNLIYLRSAFRFFQKLDDQPKDGLAPDYVYFHRSAYAGSQQWSWGMWSGDPEADWSVSDGLPAQVCAGINVGLSGIPFWGSDIGGFHTYLVPPPTPELLIRWTQFGAFSGLMRDMPTGHIKSGHRIRMFDTPELTRIVRRYQKLRTQLVPYLKNGALEAHMYGLPLMRAVFLHHPEDPKVWNMEREYFLGPDLLVAPVVEAGATTRTLYLPAGRWVNLWQRTEYDEESGGFRLGGRTIEGGKTVSVNAPLDEIPVFVRSGALIPLGDPAIDTWAPARPLEGVDVTSSESMAHRLHAWAFPEGDAKTTLSDWSRLELTRTPEGITIRRIALLLDKTELVVQIVWPEDLPAPTAIHGLEQVSDGDPLRLAPGAWTWHAGRNTLALHGWPGQKQIDIR